MVYILCMFDFFLFFWWAFELRASHLQSSHSTAWATPPAHFTLDILEMGVSQTICPGWPQTMILLISAFQEARMTGVSHQHLAKGQDFCLGSHPNPMYHKWVWEYNQSSVFPVWYLQIQPTWIENNQKKTVLNTVFFPCHYSLNIQYSNYLLSICTALEITEQWFKVFGCLHRLYPYTTSFFFFFSVLGFELRTNTLSQSTSPYCVGFYWDKVSRTICPGWLWTSIRSSLLCS
jgi:hypothetical protein